MKLWVWVLLGVIIILILGFIIGRVIVNSSEGNKSAELMQSTLLTQTLKSEQMLAQTRNMSAINTNTNAFSSLKQKIGEHDLFFADRYNDLKTKRGTILFLSKTLYSCEGSPDIIGFSAPHCLGAMSMQTLPPNWSYYLDTENQVGSELTYTSSILMLGIISDTAGDISQKEKPSVLSSKALALDVLLNLITQVEAHSKVFSYINTHNDSTFVKKIDALNAKLTLPTEDAINSMPIQATCNKYFSVYASQLKTSGIAQIFFIAPSSGALCKELDRIQKENLLSIKDYIAQSTNPVTQVMGKTYLQLLQKCPEFAWNSAQDTCGNQFTLNS